MASTIQLTDQDEADLTLYVRDDAPDPATLVRVDYLDRIHDAAELLRHQKKLNKTTELEKVDQDAIDALKQQQEDEAAAFKKQQEADLEAAIQAALDKKGK